MRNLFLIISLAFAINSFAQLPMNVPASGLVAYYPFNGNSDDVSGNNFNGALNGATLTTDRFGQLNKAYSFANVGDFIEVSTNSGLFNSQTYTYSFWIKDNNTTSDNAIISRLDNSGNVYDNFCFFIGAGKAFINYWSTTGTNLGNASDGNGPFTSDGNWTHIAITVASDSIKSYRNGVLTKVEPFLAGINFNNNFSLRFGKSAHSYWGDFSGELDEIGVWNRALDSVEIVQLAEFQNCPTHILGNDTTVYVICSNETVDLTNIIDTRGLPVQWDISNPSAASIGIHRLTVDSSGCRDTVYIAVRQNIKTWIGMVSDDWHDPLNWSDNSIPNDSCHVIINSSINRCVLRNGDAAVTSIQILKEGDFEVTNNHNLLIKGTCDTLPPLIKLAPNTVLLDSITAQHIQLVDSLKVVFSGNTTQLQNLILGNIIASGIAPNAPHGFLRKITLIQNSGSVYTFSTVEVPLTEAFEELHIDYSREYSNGDTLIKQNVTSQVAFTISTPNLILHDGDGNNNTTDDQIKVNGELELKPDMHFAIHISRFRLNYAKFECSFETDLNQGLAIGAALPNITKEKDIYSHILAFWTIPGTPIVVVPNLRVRLGAEVSTNVDISFSHTKSNRVNAFLEYQNGSWQKGYSKLTSATHSFSGITGTATAKIYVEPGIDFKLWNSNWAKGEIYVQGYVEATAQLLPISTCKLKAGVYAGAAATLEFLGWEFETAYYPKIFDYSETLYTCPSSQIPTVQTTTVSNITSTSATSGGNVVSSGSQPVTLRGVCWSTSPNPTTANSNTSNGSGTGSFSSSISGLSANTTYYVRAYATNSVGTAYGVEETFNTQQGSQIPTVTTSSVSNVTSTSATSGGNVVSSGSQPVTLRGVCWSTSPNPTTANSNTSNGSGTGSFSSSISGLSANTTYYVRAYATNSVGTAYGVEETFNTQQGSQIPTVTTSSVSNVTSTSATSGGNVTNSGGQSVTSRGVCWSTSHNPTTANNKTNDGSGTGSFSSSITGLSSNTTYYVRAYATNSIGTAYGNEINFTSTGTVINITPTDACASAPTMQINTEYQVNVSVTNYTFGAPIAGQSFNGNNIRGFWLAIQVPTGGYATNVKVYDVSSNFDPVVGLKSFCTFDYYPNTNNGFDYANSAGYGGTENFGTGLPGPETGNDGLYYIRIYHYYGSETPTISFKIKVQ